jgi:glycosyltransferase involved in cell wall biosynthesis
MRTSLAVGHGTSIQRDGYHVVRLGGRYTVFPRGVLAEACGRHGETDGLLEVWNGVPWLSPLWARIPRAVMIHHVHHATWDLVLSPGRARFGKLLETKLAPPAYRRTDIVTPSQSSREEVINLLGMAPERVSVASPGVDERFHPGDEALAATPLVLGVGRLMPPKRFDELIQICGVVRERHPELQLVIVGHGYEEPRLKQLIDDLDAHDWVHLTGRVSDEELLSLYRRAWVVASASMAEGWGMTLTEAAACGTPAVATRIAGHRDSVEDNVTGLLATDSRGMVENLDAIMRDHKLRERLAEGARKRAAKWTWDACAYGTMLPLARAATAGPRKR